YRPTNPEELFAPALDCHSGAVPDLNAKVDVDHTIAVSSYLMDEKDFWKNSPRHRHRTVEVWEGFEYLTQVHYGDTIPATVQPFLCKHAIGGVREKKMPNGDFVCSVKQLRDGAYGSKELRRMAPPGAATSRRA